MSKESRFFKMISIDSTFKKESKSYFYFEYHFAENKNVVNRITTMDVFFQGGKDSLLVKQVLPIIKDTTAYVFYFQSNGMLNSKQIKGVITDQVFAKENDSIRITNDVMVLKENYQLVSRYR